MHTLTSRAAALFALALLAGCLSQSQLIDKRISEKTDFFNTLPPEKQHDLRLGVVAAGDPTDVAWIVYGNPDRKFKKITGTTTNEVWSYLSSDVSYVDSARPVIRPVRSSNGRLIWQRDYIWSTDTYHNPYEYLRIEFQDGRVLSIQAEER